MTRAHNGRNATLRITITALFMAINIALSSFGMPVPGGHLYLNDIVICLAAILLGPFEAFAVGGIGAFIGDMLFYPA
ncbi:MAG: ECF transporter S component, partial [Oscillospiraceae bacterium]|nr:ECF transporter S component [Oscillospiraceae bacterium]